MNEHHTQKLDFGVNGYLEATRDDTEEIQDLRVKGFSADGFLMREVRVLYNIQYDYCRYQEWKDNRLIRDYLDSSEHYGHLQEEYGGCEKFGNWVNPYYPDNFEPVKKEGCDMFIDEGFKIGGLFIENRIEAALNCYILKGLDPYLAKEINLITEAEVITRKEDIDIYAEILIEEQNMKFDPKVAREKRIKFLENHSEYIGVKVPYDSRFMD